MTWCKTHFMLSLQSKKVINYFFLLGKNFGTISTSDMFKIFDATVKPVLCYGSQLWGYQCIEKIVKIHVQFCKRLCFYPKMHVIFQRLESVDDYPYVLPTSPIV